MVPATESKVRPIKYYNNIENKNTSHNLQTQTTLHSIYTSIYK